MSEFGHRRNRLDDKCGSGDVPSSLIWQRFTSLAPISKQRFGVFKHTGSQAFADPQRVPQPLAIPNDLQQSSPILSNPQSSLTILSFDVTH